MIPDSKKEEIREAADIVEVVEDYVKLKRSGRSYKGLCPFHDEKTPSFHVTPDLGIYKCFGCGESGDVFNFVMEMEGVGFMEAMRTLGDRYGVSLPEEEDPEFDEEHHLREGVYHALRYAGVFFYRKLTESDEAEPARHYLHKRGYDREVMKKFGLGFAPDGGDRLYRAAVDSGLNEQYMVEAGLIKPSQRGDGFYDTFRGRLMFPIFNPSGKVIAFAGRIIGKEKTAKYINSPQTKVYNKSEVLYGVNLAKNAIRKTGDVLLVEGYTDVITLNLHDIKNVVASSGTSLTSQQMHLLHRYGDTITMIYDSDSAGQAAMKRGIHIALSEGMDVKLLELPEGEDPDSFVRQFGKDSFLDLKKEESVDFLNYLIHSAQNEGRWEKQKDKVITEVLGTIAHISDKIKREVKVQKLNEISKVGDRALFEELGKILVEVQHEKERARQRQKRQSERERERLSEPRPPDTHTRSFERQIEKFPDRLEKKPIDGKKPNYEKELIRLMLMYGREMIDYIGSLCNEQQFEDPNLQQFYLDIIERFKADKEISVQAYADREHPYPQLVGEIVLEEHSISERHPEKTGVRYKRDKNPYQTAKGALKALKKNYLLRLLNELTRDLNSSDDGKRKEAQKMKMEIQRQKTRFERFNADELFPDPESGQAKRVTEKVFEYKMKTNK